MSTRVTKYRGASGKKAKASETCIDGLREVIRKVYFTNNTNSHKHTTHLICNSYVYLLFLTIYTLYTTVEICLSRFFFMSSIFDSVHPPSVHRPPASLTTSTVHTKGVSTKKQTSVVVIVMTIVIDVSNYSSQL